MNEMQEKTGFVQRNVAAKGEFDFRRYYQAILDHKRLFTRFLTAAGVLFILAAMLVLFFAPKERASQAQVRFLFTGADEGKYPNGDLFSSMELISTPILKEVYEANELEGAIPFQQFKNRFTVTQENPERDALEADYMARMADTKIPAVERDRLLREFRAKQAALRSSEYRLVYIEHSAFRTVSPLKLRKILSDIIATWARNADQRKGAMFYRVPILSPNMVNTEISQVGGDPVVALDILRNQIIKIIINIDQLDSLPGAAFIRDEKEQDHLADIRNRLQELVRYQINPMIGQVRAQGISSDPAKTINYLESQLFQLSLQKRAAQDKVKLLEDSLRNYLQERGGFVPAADAGKAAPSLTMIPMVSSDFFQQIMALGQEGSDLEYRKEITERIIVASNDLVDIERDTRYYEEFLVLFKSRMSASRIAPQVVKNFENQYRSVAVIVIDAVQKVNQIYERISKNNLNPDTLLYRLISPPSSTVRSALSLKMIVLLSMLFWFLVFGLGSVLLFWKVNLAKK